VAGTRVTGLRETVRALERYGASTQDLKGAFGKIADLVARRGLGRVQRGETGRLAASIRPAKTKNKAVVRAGGARVPYAGVRHWGGQIPKGPLVVGSRFLADPADESTDESVRLLHEELKHLADALGLNS